MIDPNLAFSITGTVALLGWAALLVSLFVPAIRERVWLVTGWLHYLAFDMVVGTLIARDGTARGVPALLLVPALALTFLFGPAGLVLHLLLRFAFRGRQSAEVTA